MLQAWTGAGKTPQCLTCTSTSLFYLVCVCVCMLRKLSDPCFLADGHVYVPKYTLLDLGLIGQHIVTMTNLDGGTVVDKEYPVCRC